MNDSKKYTVIELADILGVPRTTVNDWLSRYSQYIDYKVQGKRKIYTEDALTILKEISDLRNSGLSSFDIEEALAKKHPVHGEVAHHSDLDENDASSSENPDAASEDYSLIAKKHSDEIAKMINENLHNISQKISDIEDISSVSASKTGRWSIMAFLLFITLIAVSAAATYKIMEYMKMYHSLETQNKLYVNELEHKKAVIDEKEKALNDAVVKLDKNSDNFKKNILSLEVDLKKQETEFRKLLESMEKEKEEGKIKETQIIKLRDEFARERLSLLKKIDETNKEKLSKEQQIKTIQAQNAHIKKQWEDTLKQYKKDEKQTVSDSSGENTDKKPSSENIQPKSTDTDAKNTDKMSEKSEINKDGNPSSPAAGSPENE